MLYGERRSELAHWSCFPWFGALCRRCGDAKPAVLVTRWWLHLSRSTVSWSCFFFPLSFCTILNQLICDHTQKSYGSHARIKIKEWFLPTLQPNTIYSTLPFLLLYWCLSLQPSEGSRYLFLVQSLIGVMSRTVKLQLCTADALNCCKITTGTSVLMCTLNW